MAQRTLDSAFWDDEKVAALSFPERLLYACMFTDASLSDDFGRLPAHPRVLRKHAFGYDDGVTVEQVYEWRNAILSKMGKSLILYQVDGQDYIQLVNFQKWQQLRYRRKSNIPAPDAPGAVLLNISENFGNLPEPCANFPLSSVELSSVESGGGGEAQGQEAPTAPAPAPTPAAPPTTREQRTARAFELVREAGVRLNALMADQYCDLLDECGDDFALFEESIADAIAAGAEPVPKYLRSTIDRCRRERCRPGQWAGARRPGHSNGARASPRASAPKGGPPGSDDEIMPSGLTRRQERLNRNALAGMEVPDG